MADLTGKEAQGGRELLFRYVKDGSCYRLSSSSWKSSHVYRCLIRADIKYAIV